MNVSRENILLHACVVNRNCFRLWLIRKLQPLSHFYRDSGVFFENILCWRYIFIPVCDHFASRCTERTSQFVCAADDDSCFDVTPIFATNVFTTRCYSVRKLTVRIVIYIHPRCNCFNFNLIVGLCYEIQSRCLMLDETRETRVLKWFRGNICRSRWSYNM